MTNPRLLELIELFEQHADFEKATQMSAYMKNKFPFYGIQTPLRRKLYAEVIKSDKKKGHLDWHLLDEAWNNDKRELHYFVCDYLKGMHKLLTYEDIDHILGYAKTNQWWDSIDHFDRIIGNVPDLRVNQLMLELAVSNDLWMRRMAIDHQLGRKEKTNTELLEAIIVRNFGSNEFFINKAIGWSLRDFSKTNPEWVRSFIDTHREMMAPLSIREASKYI